MLAVGEVLTSPVVGYVVINKRRVLRWEDYGVASEVRRASRLLNS